MLGGYAVEVFMGRFRCGPFACGRPVPCGPYACGSLASDRRHTARLRVGISIRPVCVRCVRPNLRGANLLELIWGAHLRGVWLVGFVALAVGFTEVAFAADLITKAPPFDDSAPWEGTLYDPSTYEVRGGVFATMLGPEIGSFDLNGAIVLPKFYTVPGIANAFIPRLDAGGMANVSGKTSYAYVDALWTVNFTKLLFSELAVGGAVHDGPLSELGCRELVALGANFGYRIDAHWSAMLSFQHLSNGKGYLSDCTHNDGLNNIGLRFGYAF